MALEPRDFARRSPRLWRRPGGGKASRQAFQDEFQTLDYGRILETRAKPAHLFDGRKIPDLAKREALGFRVQAIGKAPGGA